MKNQQTIERSGERHLKSVEMNMGGMMREEEKDDKIIKRKNE